MTLNKSFFGALLLSIIVVAGCGGNPCTQSTDTPSVSTAPTGNNVMQVTVNGSLCSGTNNYANEPCASVTICSHGSTTNCATINNILVDTGSFGLRVFQPLVSSLGLQGEQSGGATVAECVTFGDGSSEWGQVATADVSLGGETAPNVPIMLINSAYATPPSACNSENSVPDTDPAEAGFNGILGVGTLQYDCGTNCQSLRRNGQYYTCTGAGTCTAQTMANNLQVQNPVTLMPTDNNGVILEMPAVTETCGAASATGYMVMGIGTGSNGNNTPSGVTAYQTDQFGDLQTIFSAYSSSEITAFVDSGSSDYFIPSPGSNFPDCGNSEGSTYEGFLCPSSSQSLSAVNYANGGTPSGTVTFSLNNAYNLLNSGNAVFSNIAGISGTGSNAFMDYGIPFFYGRTIVVATISSGTSGTANTASLGTPPPYVAY